jgi:hypothetical protein
MGDGHLPALPNGAAGSRMVLSDVRGRSLGLLAWDGARWRWSGSGGTGNLHGTIRPGVAVARYEDAKARF